MPPPPPTTSTGTPQKPASVGELVVIIILTLLFPLIGLVLGIMRVTKPEKRNEGWILLGISIFIMLFYVVLMFK